MSRFEWFPYDHSYLGALSARYFCRKIVDSGLQTPFRELILSGRISDIGAALAGDPIVYKLTVHDPLTRVRTMRNYVEIGPIIIQLWAAIHDELKLRCREGSGKELL